MDEKRDQQQAWKIDLANKTATIEKSQEQEIEALVRRVKQASLHDEAVSSNAATTQVPQNLVPRNGLLSWEVFADEMKLDDQTKAKQKPKSKPRFRQITVPKGLGKSNSATNGLFPSEVQGVVAHIGSTTAGGSSEPIYLWRDTDTSRAVFKTQQGARSLLGFRQLSHETFYQQLAKVRMAVSRDLSPELNWTWAEFWKYIEDSKKETE